MGTFELEQELETLKEEYANAIGLLSAYRKAIAERDAEIKVLREIVFSQSSELRNLKKQSNG